MAIGGLFMKERALLLGKSQSLVGILTKPPVEQSGKKFPAVILLNAGILHRVGPYRLYVKIARDLASLGFVVLRFDLSGVGDSPAQSDGITFREKWLSDIDDVMNFLQEKHGMERFLLIGICSGAEFSYRAACRDERVAGAVLINPQTHLHDAADESLHTYIQHQIAGRHNMRIGLSSSFAAKKWLKVARGEVDFRSLARIFAFQLKNFFHRNKNVSAGLDQVEAALNALNDRGVRLLHVYSEGDVGLDYLELMLGGRKDRLEKAGKVRTEIIPGSNHTFTLLSNQEDLMNVIRNWSQEMVHKDFYDSE